MTTPALPERQFQGRGAVVTGAGGGIGAEVARRLAAQGARVALFDIDGEAVTAVAEEIGASGGVATGFGVDVSSVESVSAAVGEAAEGFGPISLLASCAGVVRYGTVVDTAIADWDLQIRTNLTGPFLLMRTVIPQMRTAGGGAIVSIASVQAFASQPLVAAYSASKGGLVSLTKTVALDHAAEGIRVNCVCPGSIETPMLRYGAEVFGSEDVDATMRGWGENHPVGFLGQPSDIASAVMFLLSDQARFITGSTLTVDGGLLARLAV